MKKFIIATLLFLMPFYIPILTYVVFDPFMVVWKYDSFYNMNNKVWIDLDKDYVSTTTFDKQYKEEGYNSFIFGSSRSIFYEISDWKKHIGKSSKCYHFDASDESLYGLGKKIKYINDKGLKIENALLIFDYNLLVQDKPRKDHLYAISPQLENKSNAASFHLEFLKAFLSFPFLYEYIDYKFSGRAKPYMKTIISKKYDDKHNEYDLKTNEIRFRAAEELISEGKYYTDEKMKEFYKRDSLQTYSDVAIKENSKKMLKEIFEIFNTHGTNYKIIISPKYDQLKINEEDLSYLIKLFGEKNVFNFSGKNNMTDDYKNYYDPNHYRSHIAREVMSIIYKNE